MKIYIYITKVVIARPLVDDEASLSCGVVQPLYHYHYHYYYYYYHYYHYYYHYYYYYSYSYYYLFITVTIIAISLLLLLLVVVVLVSSLLLLLLLLLLFMLVIIRSSRCTRASSPRRAGAPAGYVHRSIYLSIYLSPSLYI